MAGMTSDGNRARFQGLVLSHLADAYALAGWLAGNRTDAEDIVQEACMRAFQGFGAFAGGSPRAWLLTIVRNTAYGWLSKNRSAMLVLVDDIAAVEQKQACSGRSDGGGGTANPETALIEKADAARLKAAIAGLPLAFRETLVLRDVQGLDYREIAEVTKVPVGTVMSRLARARQRLVAAIARDDE
jgi:RNA polymerase sigma-70 factor (ECF subfamily)